MDFIGFVEKPGLFRIIFLLLKERKNSLQQPAIACVLFSFHLRKKKLLRHSYIEASNDQR